MARYYNGAKGRFLTIDKESNSNLYAYVENDPINKTDSLGTAWHSKLWSGVKKSVIMTWSGVKWISGYSDVKTFVKNPSPANFGWALTAIPFLKVGKIGKLFKYKNAVLNKAKQFLKDNTGSISIGN